MVRSSWRRPGRTQATSTSVNSFTNPPSTSEALSAESRSHIRASPSFPDGEQYLMRGVTDLEDRTRGRQTLPSVVMGPQQDRYIFFSMRPTGLTTGLHRCKGESSRVDSLPRPLAARPGLGKTLQKKDSLQDKTGIQVEHCWLRRRYFWKRSRRKC